MRRPERTANRRVQAPLVAHIVHRFDVGGLENGLVNLINHMPAERYRHAIVCLTDFSDFRSRLRDETTPVLALHKRVGQDPGMHIRLWRALRSLKPDIVHSRNLGTLECAITALFAGVPRRIHGEHGWDVYDLHGNNRRYRLLRRVCQPFLQRYVTVSRHLESWLRDGVGIGAGKVTQIYNGVDTSRFRPAAAGREPLPQPDFAPPDSLVLGTVGRMAEVKDPLTLARCFVRLIDAAPDGRQRLRLVMIGDGPLYGEVRGLLERADALGLAWLPGSRDDVAQLLRGLDLFVLPSLNEGISNTILEAMATGLPVVATRTGGNPELVEHGRTGSLVPPADPAAMAAAVEAYARDAAQRRRHGEAARERCLLEFSLDVMVGRYGRLYDDVLGPRHAA